MAPLSPTTPIIIGIGEIKNKSTHVRDAIEPAGLMALAIQRSLEDAQLSPDQASSLIDSLSVVPTWTWPYKDITGVISAKVGISPAHAVVAEHGGHGPAELCDEAARRIALGKSKMAVITGGEALASLAACGKAGTMPPPGWTEPDTDTKRISVSDISTRGKNLGTSHSIGLPIHIYPMYENSLRAHRGQTHRENNLESSKLYEDFDRIACQQEYSWRSGEKPKTASDIGAVTKRNRIICSPYPLLMNAFNTVNLSAACLITSVEEAERLRIPKDKWVYLLGGAGTHEREDFWERPNFYSCPALEQAIDSALEVSQLSKSDIDAFDIYSCFPIVPKLACRHLGFDSLVPPKPISLLGGLTSFGGAGNNYSMHALTEMTRQLRKGQFRTGLVLANGGVLSHEYAVCLSSSPRKGSEVYPEKNPLPKTAMGEESAVPVVEKASGKAVIETYTVQFDRNGQPELGMIVGRVKDNNRRFVANHGDDFTLRKLADSSWEPVGQLGTVSHDDESRNVFFFPAPSKM